MLLVAQQPVQSARAHSLASRCSCITLNVHQCAITLNHNHHQCNSGLTDHSHISTLPRRQTSIASSQTCTEKQRTHHRYVLTTQVSTLSSEVPQCIQLWYHTSHQCINQHQQMQCKTVVIQLPVHPACTNTTHYGFSAIQCKLHSLQTLCTKQQAHCQGSIRHMLPRQQNTVAPTVSSSHSQVQTTQPNSAKIQHTGSRQQTVKPQ